MDEAPESFPYRCLPLAIANGHGWEILSPCGFEAEWNGGMAVEDVVIRTDEGTGADEVPVALFGQGIFTIHVQGLLRTPAGWNIYVSGPPNSFKDGAMPLAGIMETDWSPYTFTMNWRLTRPNHPVRFEENEPIAYFFPIERGIVEQIEPAFVPIDEDLELKAMFQQWSRSRDAFQQQVREHPPKRPADKWQKFYYRGLTPDGKCPVTDHQSKLQVREFAHPELTGQAPAAMENPVARKPPPAHAAVVLGAPATAQLAKYEWLLETMERQRALSASASGIFHCENLTGEEFLDDYYAPARPVVIAGEIEAWPAYRLWTAQYLRSKLGGTIVEFQGGRTSSADFERYKDEHKRQMPFDQFIDMIENESGNDAYITAYNSATNRDALQPLGADVRPLDKFLAQSPDDPGGMVWIGPKGTFTALHHDLTNNLLVQVTGRKRVILAAAMELPKLYNDKHVFSTIRDVSDPTIDPNAFPLLRDVHFHEIILEAGQALFIPVGWWHQVTSLDFSITITYTNFKWKNDAYLNYTSDS